MRPTPWPAAALLLTTLAGCATAPMYVQEIPPNAACIQGDAPGWIGAAPGGGARVSILEIDGYGITGGGPQCVAPGQHRLGVRAVAGNQAVQEYVDLNLQGGRLYALRAQSHGIAFVFSLVDVTGGAEASVARFSLRAGYVGVAAPPSVYYYPSYTEAYIGGGAARPRHQRPPAPHAQGPAPAPVVSPPTPLPEHRPNRKGPAWSGNQGSRCAGGGTGLAECIGQQDRRDNHRRPGPPPANGGDVGLGPWRGRGRTGPGLASKPEADSARRTHQTAERA